MVRTLSSILRIDLFVYSINVDVYHAYRKVHVND